MAEAKQPKVINKSGTLKMTDEVAATKETKDIAGRRINSRNNRNRVKADVAPKEFDEITINIDRVSRTVKGGRRMRFKALVAIGNHKNKVGIGVAKGGDVTAAVQKATAKAKKNLVTFNMNGETICHEVETKVTGANILMKPAAPGTGIIAGGVVRSIIGLTGVKNLISKSLGSTNKVNIAYAVVEGLKQQIPRSDWVTTGQKSSVKSETKAKSKPAKPETTETTETTKTSASPKSKPTKKTVKSESPKTTKTAGSKSAKAVKSAKEDK